MAQLLLDFQIPLADPAQEHKLLHRLAKSYVEAVYVMLNYIWELVLKNTFCPLGPTLPLDPMIPCAPGGP